MEASGIRIVVERGDLRRLEVAAVVDAANTHLWMGGGVAGAREATASDLRQADAPGLASAAFPALGTRVGGFDCDRCAREMLAATRAHDLGAHAAGPPSLQTVLFSLVSNDAVDAFKRVLAPSESRG